MKYLFSIYRLKHQYERFKRRLKGQSTLQSYERQQEKFSKKYPKYQLGIGTYGAPTIQDSDDGTSLHIGAFCSFASGVQIFLGNHHRTDWVSSYPFPAFFEKASHIKNFVVSRGDVTIGNDVWLCTDCTILSGVSIGHGAVVGAGAVVTRDVEPYAIVAGNPARVVRFRFDEATRSALLEVAWWSWPLDEVLQNVELLCTDQVDQLIAYAKSRKEIIQ